MRIFYDTEFSERGPGKPIELISIGMVRQDDKELYLQSVEVDHLACNDWVQANVLRHLKDCPCCIGIYNHQSDDGVGGKCRHKDCPWRNLSQLRDEIRAFVGDEKPEFWGYYSAYDHVALCQIFGAMIDLPKGWPMYTRDIKQWCDALGNPQLPAQGKDEHHALSDARWVRTAWQFLHDYEWRLPTMDGTV